MDPQTHGMIVEAEVENCSVELYINGIPVGLCGVGISQTTALPVNEYLIDGENELAVLINPGDTPVTVLEPSTESKAAFGAQPPDSPLMEEYLSKEEEKKENEEKSAENENGDTSGSTDQPPGERRWTRADVNYDVEGLPALPDARFTAKLSLYPVGIPIDESQGELLMSLSWDAHEVFEQLREEERPFPRIVRIARDLGSMFGPVHWQDGMVLKLDEKTVEQAKMFVMQIHELIEEGQAEPILNISQEKFKEVTAAYGLSMLERLNMFRKLLEEESAKDYWIFETPDDEDYSFRLVAGGRMIECIGPDWLPIIRGVPDPEEGRFMYPMMIGKIKGDWIIMR